MSNNKAEHLHIRCTTTELQIWKAAAAELECSLTNLVRTWLNFGCERDKRGRLVRK